MPAPPSPELVRSRALTSVKKRLPPRLRYKLYALKVRGINTFEATYARATGLLPAHLAGRIDYLRPSYRERYGGPLNGQQRRQEIVRQLARAIPFEAVLETGTLRGSATEFFASVFRKPVWTVENDPRFVEYSRRRFARNPAVNVELGDSRRFLERFLDESEGSEGILFVYLDAHWQEDLPLAEELSIIARAGRPSVVMVDDFQVPDDSGYRYDDYGPGKALVEDYLPVSLLHGWALMYPTVRSEEETGARRGCCVLASPGLIEQAQVPGLATARIL